MDKKNNIKKITTIINNELTRQRNNVELIASENYVSENVLKAAGSILTNKYAEGYPGRRYYGGCHNIDELEQLAINMVKKIFSAKYANVQAHSGSQANFAAYASLLNLNDTILSMDLNSGGHLTHGSSVNFSGKFYRFVHYSVNKNTETLDYDEILTIAKKVRPKLIVTGYSNYSRIIDFKKFREIADSVNAFLMADIAHIAGLIAAGFHPNPINYAHVVTSTTQKTLRGPRGGLILTNDEKISKLIDKAVFPGMQGGPFEHIIAAKCVCFSEVLDPSFKKYAKQVINNAKAFCKIFIKNKFHVVSNGTDNHLFTVDVFKTLKMTGDIACKLLEKASITTNMNTVPFDINSSKSPSGIRMGTPAMTTRGWKEKDFVTLANVIINILNSQKVSASDKSVVKKLISSHSKLYPKIKY